MKAPCLGRKGAASLALVLFILLGISFYHIAPSSPQGPVVRDDINSKALLENTHHPKNTNRDPGLNVQPVESKSGSNPLRTNTKNGTKTQYDQGTHRLTNSSHHQRHTENTADAIAVRFQDRRRRFQETCRQLHGNQSEAVDSKKAGGRLPDYVKGRLQWCMVLKSASSFLLQIHDNLNNELKTWLWTDPPPTQEPARFVAVREPYTRLVSAYLDRLVTSPDSWTSLGRDIIHKFRPRDSVHNTGCGGDVTFPEFVRFLIHCQESKEIGQHDKHFTPMSESCDPCQNHFDYIIHVETLKEEFSFVLESANLKQKMPVHIESVLIIDKVKYQILKEKKVTQCKTMCEHLHTLWWVFQIRGMIARDTPFPLTQSQCEDRAWWKKFPDICGNAYEKSLGRLDKEEEEWRTTLDLFLQVPLVDRLKVRQLLAKDFAFGYESTPDAMFPELKESKK